MFIPLRTNRPPRRRPVVTESLIVVNLLVFALGLAAEFAGVFDRTALVDGGHLYARDFHVWQVVTYQFLHDPRSIWHLAFNMLFLWVFGAAVEDRLGRLSFLAFYLIGGAVAGVAHMVVSPDAPVIGASGSIAAVTGAFLALFPRSRIQVLLVFFLIGIYEIPALWFIGLYFVLDVLQQAFSLLGGAGNQVAYAAHIAGYLYGFALAFALLATGVVRRGEFDVFSLFRQSRRRAAFRGANRAGHGRVWDATPADAATQLRKRAKGTDAAALPDPALLAARDDINRLIDGHELAAAAERYRALLEIDPKAVLPESRQLDLANQLQHEGRHELAARAYELLLEAYPTCPSAHEVRLILAVIYARRLGRAARARELAEAALSRLTDPGQRRLASDLLGEIDP